MNINKHQKAIFLDRDGTLIKERHFLSEPDGVELEPGVVNGLLRLQNLGYLLIVITNQSGIGRGYFTEEQFWVVQNHFLNLLSDLNIQITKTYFCPHHPSEGQGKYLQKCDCRKPRPGMILQGLDEFEIQAQKSFMIGDRLGDIGAGKNAGVTSILLRTGYGRHITESEIHSSPSSHHPDQICTTFEEAVAFIERQSL